MCSRFELNSTPRNIARRFIDEDLPVGFRDGEIRPTNNVLTIGPNGYQVRPWGLAVDWNKQPLINARAETLAEKKTFSPLLENRCLVPASAYFEWRRDGKARFKNRIELADDGLFSFAGLNDGERVTIITCAPIPTIAHVHGRMPVVLTAATEGRWIDPGADYADVSDMLTPNDSLELRAEEETPPPPAQTDLFG